MHSGFGVHGDVRPVLEALEPRLLLDGGPLITEFMAGNATTITDEDGAFSDWIEIHNPTDAPVSLDGWYLTDDADALAQWKFPDITLAAAGDVGGGDYLVVFASGEDRDDPASELHTNFKLSRNDDNQHDNVLLVMDGGETIEHGYIDYPLQLTDVSYGIYVNTSSNTLVGSGAMLSYHVPTPGDAGLLPVPGVSEGWTAESFDDSAWTDSRDVDGAGILITEINTGSTRFVEIENVSNAAIQTTGWSVLVNDPSGGVSSVNSYAWSLPDSIVASEVLYKTDDVGDNYWGSEILWGSDGPGWAMILDNFGVMRDFLAWGYTAAEIDLLEIDYDVFEDITVGDQWTGDGAQVGTGVGGGGGGGGGLISYTGGTYTENFDSMTATGTAPPTGWVAGKYNSTQNRLPPGSAPNDEPLYVDNGSSTVKSLSYNYGTTGAADRAIGHLSTSGTGDRALQVVITNNTGSDITEFTLGYTGEQWRDWDGGASPVQKLSVWYSTEPGSGFTNMGVEFDFICPQQNVQYSALDGNLPANRETISDTFTPLTPISAGQTFYITWHDQNDDGVSDNPLAVDDFSFTGVFGSREALTRAGDIDTDTAVDFARSNDPSKGTENSGLIVPFGEAVPAITGIGFSDDQQDFDDIIQTDVGEVMQGVNASLWTRIEFQGVDLSEYDALTLSMKYDDGFVAYINGVEVANRNAPATLAYNSIADPAHPDVLAVAYEDIDIDISNRPDLIHPGVNVLAIHGLNVGEADSDFLIQPKLVASGEASAPRYFGNPTPDAENDPSLHAPIASVVFSRSSGLFTESSIIVELTADSPDAVIHYTTNRTEPTAASPVYSGPLTITSTTQVRARAYELDQVPSLITSETYLKLNGALNSSDLPVMVIDTFGAGVPSAFPVTSNSFIGLFETQQDGWIDYAAGMDLTTRAGFKIRGSSTSGQSFAFEIRDEYDDDKDLALLGMPAESDWILYSSTFDDSLMNNSFIFEVSNQIGQYAVRTRFVELYLNTNDAQVTSLDHKGVYVLMEKIKQGSDRVDVEDLGPGDNTEPDVTGGYMLKIDRVDPGDGGFHTSRGNPTEYGTYCYVYPKEDDLTSAQETWIKNWFEEFEYVLYGVNFTDPDTGYAAYIDVEAFIDHHLLNELSKNPDMFWLSTYMYLPREGKMAMGPIWDFDRALGFESRSADPVGHVSYNGKQLPFNYDWWGRLFDDPDFMQKYIDRMHELRQGSMSITNLHAIVDAQTAELQNSQSGNAAWLTYVTNLKNWLTNRVAWIDSNFRRVAEFGRSDGFVAPGTPLTMSSSEGVIYYTTDGSDPRASGGGVGATATLYTGSPITINNNTKVIARVFGSSGKEPHTEWSAPSEVVLVTNTPAAASNLAITEINYNPYDPTAAELGVNPNFTSEDFEFVELANTSGATIALGRVTFVDGIEFEFGGSDTLAPGGRVVVAANQAAFEARYGTGIALAGQYGAGRDAMHLSNTGENIKLESILNATILDFLYNDSGDWPGRADGKGASLEIINTSGAYSDPDNWNSSIAYGGTPGAGPQSPVGIVINEVLTHTDDPLVDSIELHNTTAGPVDISGWFLSDTWGSSLNPLNGDYKKFQIPGGTTIPAGGYLVFDENDFNSPGGGSLIEFALDGAHGDDVWLMKADAAGDITHFSDHVEFGATRNGESLGRWPDGAGELYPMISRTLGYDNSIGDNGPRVSGSLIISELYYNSSEPDGVDDLEFIEIHNPTDQAVNLTGWRIRKGVDYDFAPGTIIAAGGTLVVLSFNPDNPDNGARVTTFRNTHGIGGSVALVGGYGGALDNDGERVQLQSPDEPPAEEPDYIPHLVEDEASYDDEAPWPTSPDGGGDSLNRNDWRDWGNDSASWHATGPTPGFYERLNKDPSFTSTPVTVATEGALFTYEVAASDPDVDDLLTITAATPLPGWLTLTDHGDGTATLDGSPLNQDVGMHQVSLRVTDEFDDADVQNFTITVYADTEPAVVQVLVRGSVWSDIFMDGLDSEGLGHPTLPRLGYRIPDGAEQLDMLPWVNLDTIVICFNKDVVVEQGDLALSGVNVTGYTIGGFAYTPSTFMATWTVDAPIGADKLLMDLSDSVHDVAHDDALDGGFQFRFNVLPGDTDRNEKTDYPDGYAIRDRIFLCTGEEDYSGFHDLNGNGRIDFLDWSIVRANLNAELPGGEPLAAAGAAVAQGAAPLATAASVAPPVLESDADLLAESVMSDEEEVIVAGDVPVAGPVSVEVAPINLPVPTGQPAPAPVLEPATPDALTGEDILAPGEGFDASIDTDDLLADILAESPLAIPL